MESFCKSLEFIHLKTFTSQAKVPWLESGWDFYTDRLNIFTLYRPQHKIFEKQQGCRNTDVKKPLITSLTAHMRAQTIK